jgi:acetate kinase
VHILAVNTGSSSLKLSLIDERDETLASHTVERWQSGDAGPIQPFVAGLDRVDAVAHRVVHGGKDFRTATVIDDDALKRIEGLTDLAPLHQPRAVAGMHATRRVLDDLPEVACFDTAFHAGMPPAAHTYALPAEWRRRWPLRRFGFHGLSHAYSSRRAAEITGVDAAHSRTVVCHLGSGASVCAVLDGKSVDTSMGFTPLEGLVMGTRSGSVDPGLVIWLIRDAGLEPAAVSEGLEHQSGLAGLSGTSGDMRDVQDGADRGDPDCRLAFDVYVLKLAGHVAAMAASLGGLDLLVFTGGVGEHSPRVRHTVSERLSFLGVTLDDAANQHAAADADITSERSAVRVAVVTAREDVEMAREAREVLAKRT